MEKKPLIISFFTKDILYKKKALELKESCENLGLEHDITELEDGGSWHENCCHKAEFILKKLEQHQRPVIWTDIDTIILNEPKILLECKADCALRVNDNVAPEDLQKILSSTMFFNNTASAKKLLTLWKKECERQLQKNSTALDQVCLRKVVLHYPTIVEMKRIPAYYLKVVENEENRQSSADDIIIYHQESRETCQV